MQARPRDLRLTTVARRWWEPQRLPAGCDLASLCLGFAAFIFSASLQAQFVVGEKLPPQPPIEEDKPIKPQPVELIYRGEPLVVPLDCSYDHFDRAGIVCSEAMPCELLLELTAVEAAGERVFVVGNIHTASATVSSILLHGEDAGRKWKEPVGQVSGAVFDAIQFVDETQGWAAGQQRELDSSTKPLLLATHNSGERWQRYPISKNDEHTGAVSDFYFDTAEHGLLIVHRGRSEGDPFELYESMNGGRSWLIRQITSTKPKLRNRPTGLPDSDWRVRADDDAEAYQIEQRRDGEWIVRSRFAAGLGACTVMHRPPGTE